MLREYQKEMLQEALKYDRLGLTLPTAFGKTHFSFALANALKGKTAIITYSNELVRQYLQTFDIPFLIGKKHYRKKDLEAMIERAKYSDIVLFNPASFHHYVKEGYEADNVIIDEADACLNLFKLQIGKSYRWYSPTATFMDVLSVMDEVEQQKFTVYQATKFWEVTENVDKREKAPYILTVRDIFFPKWYFKQYKKVYLMSGTLFKSDVKELIGEDAEIIEGHSPIPLDARRIILHTDNNESYPDNEVELAGLLKSVLAKHPERPCMVHTTYGLGKKLHEILQDEDILYFESKETKIETFESVESTNKTVLSSGSHIGLDMKGDKCRLNILLNGFFPNKVSQFVERRSALQDGRIWYEEATLREVIQACGRSTRTPEDFSKIVICDIRLINLLKKNVNKLPNYFKEAVWW